ncbi:MAG: hypothetical protein ABJN69_06885 [Hellea sp.]
MVIQTCSDVFSILMQLDAHTSLSAETVSVMLSGPEDIALYSQTNIPEVPSNDRTALPHQK